jgi:hypothetical protein
MRVLSVRQPWASLIASGRKTLELRSWTTTYRGPVLILSGSGVWRGKTEHPIGPRGVSLCVVDLVDVRSVRRDGSDDDAACLSPPDGFDFAWVFANPRVVKNAPVKGKLGLYRIDSELEALIA